MYLETKSWKRGPTALSTDYITFAYMTYIKCKYVL